jgi:hypothetical protein
MSGAIDVGLLRVENIFGKKNYKIKPRSEPEV